MGAAMIWVRDEESGLSGWRDATDLGNEEGWNGGGGSSPFNWAFVDLAAPDPLTVDNSFYGYASADLSISSQSGSDFSVGPDDNTYGGTILSASGGKFQAALFLDNAADATLDEGSTNQRYLKAGLNLGPIVGGFVHGPGTYGQDLFAPIFPGGDSLPICCASTIGECDPGGVIVTGIFASLFNGFGTDSVPLDNALSQFVVWQAG